MITLASGRQALSALAPKRWARGVGPPVGPLFESRCLQVKEGS
jgi:hypothetical protein